jgi:hypothetical protein
VSYESDKPEIDALRVVGKAAVNAGLLAQEANPAEAMKYYEAAFSMGAKLMQERLLYVRAADGDGSPDAIVPRDSGSGGKDRRHRAVAGHGRVPQGVHRVSRLSTC